MSTDRVEESLPQPRRYRLRFSLLALLVFITVMCVALAWLVKPRRVVATTLFQVDRGESGGFSDEPPLNSQEFEILKKTQIAKIKSNYVLTAALRTPSISALTPFAGRADPVEWLQEHLDVDFPGDSEVLSVRLHGLKENSADLVLIADAVAKAYQAEVVDEMRQRRLNDRDLLARNLENLNREIKSKLEMLFDISREAGRPLSNNNAIEQLDAKQFKLNATELLRLESEFALAEAEKAAKLEKRISELREAQAGLTKKIKSSAVMSSDLEVRRKELEQLQQIANEMSVKLEKLDIAANRPETIRLLQSAVISPEEWLLREACSLLQSHC